MRFLVYKDFSKEYRWRLQAGNGNIIADSGEGYKNRVDCLTAIASIIGLDEQNVSIEFVENKPEKAEESR